MRRRAGSGTDHNTKMALPMEVVISSDSTGQMWNCCIWDPRSDCTIINYKGSSSNARSLCLLSGQYVLSADNLKPLLNMWEVQRKEQHHSRMVCPGRVSSLAVTPDSTYCFAGIEEKINVWQVSSGHLLAVLSRHFQKVTNICCTDDGCYILSGGEDNLIMVWDLASILRPDSSHKQEPIHIWSQHSMPITDLHCGKCGISSRAVSSSQDQTCKLGQISVQSKIRVFVGSNPNLRNLPLWDIPSGQMLCSFVFDTPILSVTMDTAEQRLFAGGLDGNIYTVNLFEKVSGHSKLVASEENEVNFKGHSKAVTCLSVSLDGSMLLSGSEDNTARVWHVTSRQCIRTLAHKGAVTNAKFIMMPLSLQTQTGKPTLPIKQFQRQLYVPQASTEGGDSATTEDAVFRLDYSLRETEEKSWTDQVHDCLQIEKTLLSAPTENQADEVKRLKEMTAQLRKTAARKILAASKT